MKKCKSCGKEYDENGIIVSIDKEHKNWDCCICNTQVEKKSEEGNRFYWKKKKGDGYSCEAYFVNGIKIGDYHRMPTKDSRGEYISAVFLPGIKEIFSYGDRETVKADVERKVAQWAARFNNTGEQQNG